MLWIIAMFFVCLFVVLLVVVKMGWGMFIYLGYGMTSYVYHS